MDQSHMQRSRSRYTPTPQSQVHTDSRYDEDDDDDIWPTRMPSSVRRYRSDVKSETGRTHADVQSLAQDDYYVPYTRRKNAIPPRRTATQTHMPAVQSSRRPVDTEDIVPRHSGELVRKAPRFHWLFYIGIVIMIMMVGWVVLGVVTNWWQVTQDDWRYGRPRTFQIDAVVGHNDSPANPSHFIALNLRRHVEIIEFPGGDASKAKIYVGPVLIGQGQDLAVVTLSFKDVNGDGKPDMIISVQDSRFIFINDNGAFRPLRPGENVQMPSGN